MGQSRVVLGCLQKWEEGRHSAVSFCLSRPQFPYLPSSGGQRRVTQMTSKVPSAPQ